MLILCIYTNRFFLCHFFPVQIGKMFKSVELPWLITFFQMFYNDKPVDWLLEHLIYTKVCNWEKDMVSSVMELILPSYVNRQYFHHLRFIYHYCLTFLEIRNIASRKKRNYGYTTSHHYFNTLAPHHH